MISSDQCYCKQTSFDYGKQKGVFLTPREGKKDFFNLQRMVIIQMNSQQTQ